MHQQRCPRPDTPGSYHSRTDASEHRLQVCVEICAIPREVPSPPAITRSQALFFNTSRQRLKFGMADEESRCARHAVCACGLICYYAPASVLLSIKSTANSS